MKSTHAMTVKFDGTNEDAKFYAKGADGEYFVLFQEPFQPLPPPPDNLTAITF
jgi:hypothetical protein